MKLKIKSRKLYFRFWTKWTWHLNEIEIWWFCLKNGNEWRLRSWTTNNFKLTNLPFLYSISWLKQLNKNCSKMCDLNHCFMLPNIWYYHDENENFWRSWLDRSKLPTWNLQFISMTYVLFTKYKKKHRLLRWWTSSSVSKRPPNLRH